MGRLIVVSNRVNPPADTGVGTAGGLAMALAAALRNDSGMWFGWSGETTDAYSGQISLQRVNGVMVAMLDLEADDVETYYNGYSNRALWPLFHYRSDLIEYDSRFEEGYERVNRRFADALTPLIEPDDLVWVQDYHLIPLARELRQRGVTNRIGFFLHVPWPARSVFCTLPHHEALGQALFDYDLIGFQTEEYRDAFADFATQTLGAEALGDGHFSLGDRRAKAEAFPIGIDADDFIQSLSSEPSRRYFDMMQTSMSGRTMILGIDRLDYSKGLEERFLGFETFLEQNPECHEKVFMLQIATSSRGDVAAYRDMRGRLDAVSGRVNGSFATVDWVPLRYVNRPYRRDELAGICRAAKVGLITPLRDGMNLVAKEYVAAQDPEDPGVLILSTFAGAAEQMKSALIINPLSREDVAAAIRQALDMPLAERRERWADLMQTIHETDVLHWRDDFVGELRHAGTAPKSGVTPIRLARTRNAS